MQENIDQGPTVNREMGREEEGDRGSGMAKRESDLDRAARLLAMQSWGAPLDTEDLLWLEAWKGLMQEADSVEYSPSVMWSSTATTTTTTATTTAKAKKAR